MEEFIYIPIRTRKAETALLITLTVFAWLCVFYILVLSQQHYDRPVKNMFYDVVLISLATLSHLLMLLIYQMFDKSNRIILTNEGIYLNSKKQKIFIWWNRVYRTIEAPNSIKLQYETSPMSTQMRPTHSEVKIITHNLNYNKKLLHSHINYLITMSNVQNVIITNEK